MQCIISGRKREIVGIRGAQQNIGGNLRVVVKLISTASSLNIFSQTAFAPQPRRLFWRRRWCFSQFLLNAASTVPRVEVPSRQPSEHGQLLGRRTFKVGGQVASLKRGERRGVGGVGVGTGHRRKHCHAERDRLRGDGGEREALGKRFGRRYEILKKQPDFNYLSVLPDDIFV